MASNTERLKKALSEETYDDIDGEIDTETIEPIPDEEIPKGMCVECTDQPASIHCDQCNDDLCEVCGYALHRRGKRKNHTYVDLLSGSSTMSFLNGPHRPAGSGSSAGEKLSKISSLGVGLGADLHNNSNHHSFNSLVDKTNNFEVDSNGMRTDVDDDVDEEIDYNQYSSNAADGKINSAYFVERSKYIPVRLTLQERNLLRLLEASLHVSEYTDKVDIQAANRPKRINDQLRHICAILCGLLVASDFRKGQQLVEKKDFSDNELFFQTVFEIGRRHKIMNPAKMRSEYGKMIHLLQDSSQREIMESLGLELVSDLKTVYSILEEHGGLKLLEDPLLEYATREILPDGKERYQIQREIKQKETAIKALSKKYQSSELSVDLIEQCIYSIGDNHTYLRENRDSVKKMIKYLKKYFDPNQEDQYSLRITPGQAGARLNHSHQKQFMYVYQSLILWKKILHDMFRLWYLAEVDLLRGNPYALRNTGQGLNRIQSAPKISSAMGKILHSAQTKVGQYWVGSSVVHLGDHNVPNALTFIDKYTQISRILNPIVIAIEFIPKIKDPNLVEYIKNSFGGPKNLKKLILSDFFKHAFDGSGADNFFDAGSCIDGRLTSAWNWCSKIEKKSYYSIFLLSGFSGFDGSFN